MSGQDAKPLLGHDNADNRDPLEIQSCLAFEAGNLSLAAAFAQAAGLYAIACAINGLQSDA